MGGRSGAERAGAGTPASVAVVPAESVQRRILAIRGEKVMLDGDLAELYGVETRTLVQAVKRNRRRFPADFMFQLDAEEFELLRSQSVMPRSWGGRRTPPYAFTEQGVAMLSGVLRSERAVAVNIEIMRAFVSLRHLLATKAALAQRLDDLERRFEQRLGEHDEQLQAVFTALRQLVAPPPRRKRPIGFAVRDADADETP